MKKLSGLLQKRQDASRADSQDDASTAAARGVSAFCESGAISDSGDEVLHLPGIVDAAAASPAAAAAAARQIRKYMSRGGVQPSYAQYNAIMLIRILADHPGQTFTKCFDDKFVSVVETVLRRERDLAVQQIMRETLRALEQEKRHDRNLDALLRMWRRERQSAPQSDSRHGFDSFSQQQLPANVQGAQQPHGRLPLPAQLALRVEEARSTAKLLLQLLQTTRPVELSTNELVFEFSKRCHSASRSMQAFMNCRDPAPDEDTMLTLIETSEELNMAISQHQRALLAARRDTTTPRPATVASLNGKQSLNAGGPGRPLATAVEQSPYRSESPSGTTNRVQSRPSQISDPFSDEHYVDMVLPNSRQQHVTAWSDFDAEISTHRSTFTPDQHSIELPNSHTSARPISVAHELHTEAFNDAPLASHSLSTRTQNFSQHARPPPPSLPHPQYAAQRHEMQSTPSYVARQSDAVNFHVMSGAASSSQPEQRQLQREAASTTSADHSEAGLVDSSVSPLGGDDNTSRGKRRIKDDSPIPELESSGEGFGWRRGV